MSRKWNCLITFRGALPAAEMLAVLGGGGEVAAPLHPTFPLHPTWDDWECFAWSIFPTPPTLPRFWSLAWCSIQGWGGKNSLHEPPGGPQPDPARFKRAEFLCAGITAPQRGYWSAGPHSCPQNATPASQHCFLDSGALTPGTNKGFQPLPLPTHVTPGMDGESEEAL